MKFNWKAFLIALVIPLGVGGASALLTHDSMETFAQLAQPPLSPPGWIFPVVWTVLFAMMGIASYLVYVSHAPKIERSPALLIYGVQLMVNFFWSILFFRLGWYLFSFFWLLMLWLLILGMLLLFYRISKWSALLILPYLLWVSFAGYLNFGIYLLN